MLCAERRHTAKLTRCILVSASSSSTTGVAEKWTWRITCCSLTAYHVIRVGQAGLESGLYVSSGTLVLMKGSTPWDAIHASEGDIALPDAL